MRDKAIIAESKSATNLNDDIQAASGEVKHFFD